MSIQFPEFVGRIDQLSKIDRQIERHGQTAVVNIAGAGGVGKTAILRQIRKKHTAQPGVLVTPIIDFSLTIHRIESWILKQITAVSSDDFQNYHREARELETLEPLPRLYREQEVQKTFIKDYNRLASNYRMILLLDTIELVQATPLLEFVIELIAQLDNTTLILAGRQNDEPALIQLLHNTYGPDCVETFRLGGFSSEEAKLYFEKAHTPRLKEIHDDLRENIYLLSEGNAIKIALALDWLDRGIPFMPEITQLHPEELRGQPETQLQSRQQEFEYALMSGIRQLQSPVDEIILFMAHLNKRFNRNMLNFFFNHEAKEDDKGLEGIILQLQSLPFVKYISDDYFVLHDEMVRLVQEHVWTVEDPDKVERRKLSTQASKYYQQELDALPPPGERTEEDKINYWSYRVEQMYYNLYANFRTGYHDFETLFEQLDNDRRPGLAALAVKFVREFEDEVKASRLLPCLLNGYYEGGILLIRQQFNTAQEKLIKGLKELNETLPHMVKTADPLDSHLSERLYQVYHQLGYCYRSMGRWEDGIKQYNRSLDLALQRIEELEKRPLPAEEEKKTLITQIAETLNNLANVHRLIGDFHHARLFCQTSIFMRRAWDPDQVIKNLYVMAMILWEMGATAEAMRYLREAEKTEPDETMQALITKHRAYIYYRAGLPKQAEPLLKRAESVFRERGQFSELAETLLNLSRIYRGYARQKDEKLEEHIKQADHYTRQAQEIAIQIGDEFRESECHLTKAINYYHWSHLQPGNSSNYRQLAVSEHDAGLKLAQGRYYRLLSVYSELRGNLAFDELNFDLAFAQYIEQCRLATRFKRAVYERSIDTIGNRLRTLATKESGQAIWYADCVLDAWQQDAQFAERYPELIDEINQIKKTISEQDQLEQLSQQYEQAFLQGKWKEAMAYCDQILAIPGLYRDVNRANVILKQVRAALRSGRLSEARRLSKVVLQIGKVLNDFTLIGSANLWLARILWDATNTAEAATHLDEAQEAFMQTQDKLNLARVQQRRSYIQHRTGFFKEPMHELVEVINTFREKGMYSELASVLNVMSRIARTAPSTPNKRSFELARRYVEAALQQALATNDSYRIAECYLTLTITAFREKKYEEALNWCQKGLDILSPETHLLISVYNGIRGSALFEQGYQTSNSQQQSQLWNQAFDALVLELFEATKSKPARLVRALDLVYEMLMRLPEQELEQYTTRIRNAWTQYQLEEEFPIVIDMCAQSLRYRHYI